MSDMEKLKALLDQFGLLYDVEVLDTHTAIKVEGGTGYLSMHHEFHFVKEEFTGHGIWGD